MKKFFNTSFLCLTLFIASCGSINKAPKAINKPKNLTNANIVKPVAPTPVPQQNLNRTDATIPEVIKLFDFSNKTNQTDSLYTPYGTEYSYTKVVDEVTTDETIEEPIQQLANEEVVKEEKKSSLPQDSNLRVAVILPLTGNASSVANDLKNAATMALFNLNSDNIILQFYDSEGTSTGAKEATLKATEDNANIIVGPLFADEVASAKKVANAPIISFTTDQSVLSKNVFSIGFLIEQQIKRIVEYSIENGYKRFAIIVPDNETGNFMINNFKKYVKSFDGEVVITKAYKNKKEDLMKSVKEISNFDERSNEYKQYMSDAKARLQYLVSLKSKPDDTEYLSAYDDTQYLSTDDEIAFLENIIEELSKKTTISDPDYDSIFIYGDDINDVIMIGSSLMYYDVHPDRIKFLGTSQLENTKIYGERAFNKAWYPSVSTKYSGKFNQAYKEHFGTTPNKIASLAYDAVSLIGIISQEGNIDTSDILNPNGWTGINGIFRFNRDGSSERNMDVKQIVGGGITKTKVISPANVNFLY
ncbi:MAG: penicillin-binding protein activator [Alphaproteobacteria bacterium]